MKKIDWTIDGGLEAVQEVFDHQQDGVIEAFSSLLKNTGTGAPNGVILWGCEVTISGGGNTADITAGAVYLDGEIYSVDAASGITKTGSDTFVFDTVSTTATPTLDYFDATTQDPLLDRKAELTFVASGSAGSFMPYNADKWLERVLGAWEVYTTSSADFTADGSSGNSWSVLSSSISYWFNSINVNISLRISIASSQVVTAASAYLRFRLPLGPNGNRINIGPTFIGIGIMGTDMLVIKNDGSSNGWIRLYKADGTNFGTGFLGEITINLVAPAFEL